MEKEIEELEKLIDSLKFLALDVGRKLGDSTNHRKNITHMGNIYRKAAAKGYSFQTFLDIATVMRKDIEGRKNVRNKGAYFYKALEKRLGLDINTEVA